MPKKVCLYYHIGECLGYCEHNVDNEKLKQMEEEFVIDRFEGDIAICEDRKTGEKKEIRKELLEEGLIEGSIIKKENGKYVQSKEKQEEIEERIERKMKQIWK